MTTETTTAPTTDAEMLRLLRNPEFAIRFAMEHLQPWELAMFFTDWQDDADMTGWLREWREKQELGGCGRAGPDADGGRPNVAGMRIIGASLR